MSKRSVFFNIALVFLLTAKHSEAISFDAELQMCRRLNDVSERIKYCGNVIANTKDHLALEIAHKALGNAFVEIGTYANAIQHFTYIINTNPRIAGYFDDRRIAYQKAGQFSNALDDENHAVKLAPQDSFVYRGRASVYADMGKFEEALTDFNTAIQLDSSDGGLFAARGKIFKKLHRYDDAVNDFGHALFLNQKLIEVYRERGLTYQLLGQREQAREDLQRFAQRFPQDEEVTTALREITLQVNPAEEGDSSRERVPASADVILPMEQQGGTYTVLVQIDKQISLRFVVDSGASDVSIPSDVVSTLKRTGTIDEGDFLGSQIYVLADGTRVPSARFNIKTLTIVGIEIKNVQAGIAPEKGELLLGQSFLGRFSSWSMDNNIHALKLKL